MAVHWDGNGRPNEFMSKQVVIALIPCLIIFLHGLMYIISHNIYKFNEDEHVIISGFLKTITLFMLFIHMLILFINFGSMISFQTGLTIGISMFLFMLSKAFKKSSEYGKRPNQIKKNPFSE